MAARQVVSVHSTSADRLGALAKWIAAKAEEMAQLDRKIDRRLEHLQRSEDNLRAMFEALRDQVTSAHSVSEELQKRTLAADQRQQQSEEAFSSALDHATRKASVLLETVEANSKQLEHAAETILRSSMDRLETLTEQVREAQLAAEAAAVPQQSHFESASTAVQEDFNHHAAIVVESIRRSAVEQIERLGSQAAVAVDPLLARIDAQRQRAQAQLDTAVESAEDSLRRRAEELARTGDTLVDNLEQRLARRLEDIRPRTLETLESAEQAMNQRLDALMDGASLTLSATESDLTERVNQLRPRLTQALQSVQDDLVEQLARLEEHAFKMTGWLEKRMTDRVDALITRTRTALSQTPAAPPAPLSPEALSLICYADEYPAPTQANSVTVQIFADRRSDRPTRSTTASIF